jgi:ElaB/YqjD/DUF883 family membrane-anchored ribosome-binding protein
MSENNIHAFIGELRKVVTDAEALLAANVVANGSEVGDQVHSFRDKLSASMQEAQQAMHKIEAQLRAQAHNATESTNKYVHENPWTSIGIAGVAGLLIGLVLRRR